MKREVWILIFLIVVFVGVNYRVVDSFLVKNFDSREVVFVDRVVDGDTVVINGSSVRLLGINTPEKGEYFYDDAKEFLEGEALGKSLFIERHGQDRYYRDLVYLFDFHSGENINLKVVRKGYGNFYFPSGRDSYSEEFFLAWDVCRDEDINLCEKSFDVCASCIALKNWDFKSDDIIFENVCDFDCSLGGWSLKDEGRKKFIFGNFVLSSGEEVKITNEDFDEDYVWTDSGDSFFLRDSYDKLVLFGSDGY